MARSPPFTLNKLYIYFGPTWPEVTAARNGGFFVPENNMKIWR